LSEYDIVNLISTVGFPIAMCLLIYFDLRTKVTREMEDIKARLTRLETLILARGGDPE